MRMISRRGIPGLNPTAGRNSRTRLDWDRCPVAEERLSGSLAVSEFTVRAAQEAFAIFPADVCVPKTSSTSCGQAVFVDQATDASLSSDAVLSEIDRLG
jgi:hypothetical protein